MSVSPQAIEKARAAVAAVKLSWATRDSNAARFATIEELGPYLASLATTTAEAAYRQNAHETKCAMRQVVHVVRELARITNEIEEAP